jgi:hypothetical protein
MGMTDSKPVYVYPGDINIPSIFQTLDVTPTDSPQLQDSPQGQGQGQVFGPQGQGQVFGPQGQGQVFGPQGQGQVFGPQGQGQVFGPQGQGQAFGPTPYLMSAGITHSEFEMSLGTALSESLQYNRFGSHLHDYGQPPKRINASYDDVYVGSG